MADFSALKTSIQNYIKQNGNEEITGNLLQQILLSMVSTLGDSAINDLVAALNAEIANRGNADTELGGSITTLQGVVNGIKSNVENGYVYAGIATPSSTPASGKVFYLALTAGTYNNFGATVVPQGINILKYNGSAWTLDSFLGLDDAPTQGSSNLVKSGGVLDSIIKDGSAFDLSAYNNGTTYADLNAALTALNALPAAYKKGGMSVKFVLSSDNKYVQYRLMASGFTTTVTEWQGVDDEPTAGSDNLVKSGGVYKAIQDNDGIIIDKTFNGLETVNITPFTGKIIIDVKSITPQRSSEFFIDFLDNNSSTITYVNYKLEGRYYLSLNSTVYKIRFSDNGEFTDNRIVISKADSLANEIYKIEHIIDGDSGSLVNNYGVGSINATSHVPADLNDVNRYSEFIKVKKGDVITVRSALASSFFVVALYSEPDFYHFVNGLEGNTPYAYNDYVYIIPQDGYAVVSSCSYYTADDFAGTSYSIQRVGKESKWYSEKMSSLPFGTFSSVKTIIDASLLPSNDYRKTYCGLGYDIVYDEANNRYCMLVAGYNESIGFAQVGLMYSNNLQDWTDYGIVLAPTGVDGNPDKGSITFPQLIRYQNKWIVYYVGFDQTGFENGVHSICCAESTDLINWTRKGAILTRQNFVDAGVWPSTALNPGRGVMYRPRVINLYGSYYMFINGGPNGDANPEAGTYENIYVAKCDTPLGEWKVLGMAADAEVLYPTGDYKICSDPDIIHNVDEFVMMFWTREGICLLKCTDRDFPSNWEPSTFCVLGHGIRPLLYPTPEKLYLFANIDGAAKVGLFEAEWN